MILRLDRLGVTLPPPSDPDPAGASAVQELMGGKFGEMSTWLNYTFQSFNFRGRQDARPFYDLLCSIATEEFGHVELVAATINTMLTGATPIIDGRAPEPALAAVKGIGNPHHFIAGGQGALPQNSQGRPWNARARTGYLLVRGGVHQVAYARALEFLTGADMMKLFPTPRIPTDKIPECKPHLERGEHLKLYRFSQDDFLEAGAVFRGPHPETGEELTLADVPHPLGAPAHDLPPQPAVFAPGYAPEEIKEIADKLRKQVGLPDEVTGVVSEESKELLQSLSVTGR
jgi:Mn-containing catalase